MSTPEHVDVSFERCHFDPEVVALCVRWYLGSRLSLRDLVGLMAERGLPVAHTTLLRWTRRCTADPARGQHHAAGSSQQSCRIEESRIRVRGGWRHLYRAVDVSGQTVDFWLADRRSVAAARAFFGRVPSTAAAASAARGTPGVGKARSEDWRQEDLPRRDGLMLPG